ncbi:SDR family NAD(P)-dependent oxidoreductase [Niveibacterium sp.]|uniref:SDR family NAD(P)-dependent oxidoreductase n=1 Tax=Niveibacterium sp. TaxID=2017444 RepID=UPI0035B23D1D
MRKAAHNCEGKMLRYLWKSLKRWRAIELGPIAQVFRLDRSTPVTRNGGRRVRQAGARHRRWLAIPAAPASQPYAPTGAVPAPSQPPAKELALIVGVGPGYGYALARRLAREGMAVVVAARNAVRLDTLVAQIESEGGTAFAYGCDATNEASVTGLFSHVAAQHGVPDLVVYALQSFGPGLTIDVEVPAFEEGWRKNCLGSFLVARAAARAMLLRERGTIILTGSTSSLLGRAGHLNLAVGKFGQRALAQVLARELWSQGIHVAHIVIDADIHEGQGREDGGPQSDPEHISETIIALHRQPRSAWSSELDVRPWNEQFWEHC